MNYDFICDSRKEDNNGYLYGCIKISFNCGGDVGDVGMAMSLDGRTFITEDDSSDVPSWTYINSLLIIMVSQKHFFCRTSVKKHKHFDVFISCVNCSAKSFLQMLYYKH